MNYGEKASCTILHRSFFLYRNSTVDNSTFLLTDLKKIVVDTSSNFDKMMNIKCCFPKLLACRTYHLNKVTMSVARMVTLMEKLYPPAEEFNKLEARGEYILT